MKVIIGDKVRYRWRVENNETVLTGIGIVKKLYGSDGVILMENGVDLYMKETNIVSVIYEPNNKE